MRALDPSCWSRESVSSALPVPVRWTHPPQRVREVEGRYEDEGTVRESRGAVSVARDAWWSAALAIPVPDSTHGDAIALVRLTRHGRAAAGVPRQEAIEFSVSCAELEAVVTLLAGVAAQARRGGLIADAGAAGPG